MKPQRMKVDTDSYNFNIFVYQSEKSGIGGPTQEDQTIGDENGLLLSFRPFPLYQSHKQAQRETETGVRILLLLQLPLHLCLI